MDATLTLLNLAGAVALLLWGVHMVQSGVQRGFGPNLRRGLSQAFSNRLKAFATGVGVTAVLQSSTATGLMTASFAAEGLIGLVPALAIMLGANVGTTLIVQVLSFDIGPLAPLLLCIGVVMFQRHGTATRTHDLGRVAIGLGLMLMALGNLLTIITPYEDVPSLRLFLGAIATAPVIALLVGALVTWAIHSSVAVVLLVMSFASKDVIPLSTALAMVLGANIGSALNPVLETTTAKDVTGRQVAMGNLLNRLAGAIVVMPFLDTISVWMLLLDPASSRAVANFHTLFNGAIALILLPLLDLVAKALRLLLPPRFEAQDPSRPLYLEETAKETPAIAIAGATREALRMADVLEEMLRGAMQGMQQNDYRRITETRRMEDVVDALNTAIHNYLTDLDAESLSEEDDQRLFSILTFTTNLEHAGDTLDRDVMALAVKKLKRGIVLSSQGTADLQALFERLSTNLRLATTVFMTHDLREARTLAHEKTLFRDFEREASEAHIQRMRSQKSESIEASALHLELLRALKAVNDKLVAAAAYPRLEAEGELHNSRLRTRPGSVPPTPENDEK
ncbi:Na/Pi cotransporter family protein [Beijerinckia indica]|uniref:Na/Pi-cotransporter II-related protein n=1 Tax=Beijerinckia indica subsp. indica (strain ATCC 9039 / DSM 1715 / NCIMB 8712) TaxID=395963 RepID=B2IE84_BEII9|nr:Na/Pi cotransporter family protein [Beijerinckia indica]ACB94108.1 Na/Pi-cotransporter II-related protein [Beijerinckia indica subsp. indica ATCC 9039]